MNKPVAYRVQNTAGVWIYFTSKIAAESFARGVKEDIQELYLAQ